MRMWFEIISTGRILLTSWIVHCGLYDLLPSNLGTMEFFLLLGLVAKAQANQPGLIILVFDFLIRPRS
jgi:hypothetical protein